MSPNVASNIKRIFHRLIIDFRLATLHLFFHHHCNIGNYFKVDFFISERSALPPCGVLFELTVFKLWWTRRTCCDNKSSKEQWVCSFGYDISTIRALYDISTIGYMYLYAIYLWYSSIPSSSQDRHVLFLLKEKLGTKTFHPTLQ